MATNIPQLTLSPQPAPYPAASQRSKRGIRLTSNSIAGIVGGVFLFCLVFTAVFAPLLSPYNPAKRVGKPFQVPSAKYVLGTNDIGQDIFSELIFGTRISLTVGVVAALVSISIGTTIGLIAGYYSSSFGRVIMRFVDVILTLPFLPMLILFAAYLGRSLLNTILIIGLLSWASTARIIRSQVIRLVSEDYVKAARAAGAGDGYIIFHHVLPQVLMLAVGQFIQASSGAILLEASLSFLGLGDPLQKSWGGILYWAQVRGAFLTPAWKWWVLPPGLMIGVASLGFALIGFSLEKVINPRLKH
ncbi:MAG: ABC transporter permease [Anaerolineaceae bacterium]|nr:ABC transporter permease [Anaerolineaceae bacterium]